MTVFLDTYALVEILQGSPSYEEHAADAVTGFLNLFELHVQVARLTSAERADMVYRDLRSMVVEPTDDDVFAASRFKRAHARKAYSYADALGYAMSQKRRIPFVTGDRAFKDVEGVLFVR